MTSDERLRRMEAWISNLYKDAEEEMRGKWDQFFKDIKTDGDKLLQAIDKAPDEAAKKKAWREYTAFMRDATAMGKYFRQMVNSLAKSYSDANQTALAFINGKRFDFLADGYNFSVGQVNDAAISYGMGIRFDMVDAGTMQWLAEREIDFPNTLIMPPPEKLKIPEDERWCRKLIQSQVAQGIAQGESIPKIAKRLENVTDSEEKACIRRARTMATNCENAGRVLSMEKAKEWGVHTRKKWMCTHDKRTRDTHLLLDGETIDNDAVFWNGCRWPGDHLGPPAEVWNCRCTLITVVDGFSSTLPKGKEGTIRVSFDD